jgi:hypothetical protein
VQVRQQVRHLRAAPGSRETAARGAGIWGKTNGVEPLDSFWNIKNRRVGRNRLEVARSLLETSVDDEPDSPAGRSCRQARGREWQWTVGGHTEKCG